MESSHQKSNSAFFTRILFTAVLISGYSLAAKWHSGNLIHISSTEVIRDDLYIAGNDVQIDGTVAGDLIVIGQNITLKGNVKGSLWALGQKVTLANKITKSARVAAAIVELQKADIGQDLLATSMVLNLGPGTLVGRDIALFGQQAKLSGTINRNAYITAGSIEMDAVVKGNAQFTIGKQGASSKSWQNGTYQNSRIEAGLNFQKNGYINGDLTLHGPKGLVVPSDAVKGHVNFSLDKNQKTKVLDKTSSGEKSLLHTFLRTFSTIFIVGLILLLFAKTFITKVSQQLQASPGSSLGYGALILLLSPFAVLITTGAVIFLGILISILGLSNLGIPIILSVPILLGIYALTIWLAWLIAQSFAAFLLGTWIWHRFRPTDTKQAIRLLLGTLILTVLVILPIISGIIKLGICLFFLGALWLLKRSPRSMPLQPQ